MPIAFKSVTRSKNTIRFSDKVNPKAVRDFIPALDEAVNRGFTEIVLDFRQCTRAYADAVLQLVCLLDARRRRENTFRVLLPENSTLRQLFLNANWAHYLDPSQPIVGLETRQHMAARRYGNHSSQQDVVGAAVDVVLRNIELDRDVIAALEWTTNEVTDNVLNHAQSPDGGLVQVSTFREECKIQVVVADAGRGIPVAMREAFPELRDDLNAIGEALKAGVTSIPDGGQGNGLAGSLRIAEYAGGSFRISSGRAQLDVFEDPRTGRYRTKRTRAPRGVRFPGTTVLFELRTDASFSIEEALALDGKAAGPLTDAVDLRYGAEGGDLVVRVCNEAVGFGTRQAGVELRRKCNNLLNAEPTKRIMLDWTGIPVISSSFADEAIGKLFVQLGPVAFSARVVNAGAEHLVSSLLDRAIMQRVSQSMSGDVPDSLGDEAADPTEAGRSEQDRQTGD